jgi:hypothetical protein
LKEKFIRSINFSGSVENRHTFAQSVLERKFYP